MTESPLLPARRSIRLGGQLIDLSEPLVMAIINVTPDSFFADSRNTTADEVCRRVEKVLDAGAEMLDLGGYSSRPGAADVSPRQEYERVARGMRVIRECSPQAAVSVDTFRASVVERIFEEFGPILVNDISAGELDPLMIPTVARLKLPYVAMHMRGTPQTMGELTDYDDVTADVIRYFSQRIDRWTQAGIDDIILDPGFGFAKTTTQNFELLARMSDFEVLGRPVLAGISRKTMIWQTLGTDPSGALNGTTALHWECLRQGASILRAHDVREAVEVVRLFEAYHNVCTTLP
ncbi:MAG: dihydropteroate synthase [Rikenellaceae bacterium]|jgi:dihydropteroate synthase|nr:dihydropteroate synthase [Rikenellaceae bacterium]